MKSIVDGIKKAATPDVQSGIDPEALQGDSLAELWVSFLNAEAGVEALSTSSSTLLHKRAHP